MKLLLSLGACLLGIVSGCVKVDHTSLEVEVKGDTCIEYDLNPFEMVVLHLPGVDDFVVEHVSSSSPRATFSLLGTGEVVPVGEHKTVTGTSMVMQFVSKKSTGVVDIRAASYTTIVEHDTLTNIERACRNEPANHSSLCMENPHVMCDRAGHIVSLSLRAHELECNVEDLELDQMTKLVHLDLSFNDVTGDLFLPEGFESLNVAGNRGMNVHSEGACASLLSLDVSNTATRRTLLPCPSLWFLSVSGTPLEIDRATGDLQTLIAVSSSLSGALDLSGMDKLSFLNVRDNGISSVAVNTSVQYLLASNNPIVDLVEPYFGLLILDLSHCEIDDEVTIEDLQSYAYFNVALNAHSNRLRAVSGGHWTLSSVPVDVRHNPGLWSFASLGAPNLLLTEPLETSNDANQQECYGSPLQICIIVVIVLGLSCVVFAILHTRLSSRSKSSADGQETIHMIDARAVV